MSLPNTTLTVRKFRRLAASKQNEVKFSAGTVESPFESFIAFIRYSQTCNKRLFDLVRYLSSRNSMIVCSISHGIPPDLSIVASFLGRPHCTFQDNLLNNAAAFNPLSPSIYIQILLNSLREFDNRSRHFLLSDHFINSHNLVS